MVDILLHEKTGEDALDVIREGRKHVSLSGVEISGIGSTD